MTGAGLVLTARKGYRQYSSGSFISRKRAHDHRSSERPDVAISDSGMVAHRARDHVGDLETLLVFGVPPARIQHKGSMSPKSPGTPNATARLAPRVHLERGADMSHTIGLKTELREEVGKGQVKVLRRAGYVPGNVYGGGMTSTAIKVQSKA